MKAIKSRQSFFSKLLLSFLLIGVLPVIVLGIFANSFTYRLPIKKLENQSLLMAKMSLKSMDEMLDGYKSILTLLADDIQLQNILLSKNVAQYDKNLIYQKMYMLLSGRITDACMHLIEANGEFVISTTSDAGMYDYKKSKDWGIFRKLKETKDAFVYPNRYTSTDGKSISMSIGKSIVVNGEIIGYLILDLPKSTIEKTLSATTNILDMNYMILDHNFYIMYDDLLRNGTSDFLSLDFRYQLLQQEADLRIVPINGRSSLLCSLSSEKNGLLLLGEVPVEIIIQNNKYIAFSTTVMVLISVFFCCILTFIVANKITEPIKKVVRAMEKVEKGDLNTKVSIPENDEIGYMARRFNEMVEKLKDLFQTNLEKQDRLRLAEIKSLQAQINPHFLYNTLDSIKWLAKLNGIDEISVIASKLGNLLKNSINNRDDLVTVEESLHLIDSYLSIQKIRFHDKFEAEIDIDGTIMKCLVPKLVIQPVVENAIVHGIENKIGKGFVRITGKKEKDNIVFEIVDDGIGISKEKLEELRSSVVQESTSENIALSNINSRIKLYYGDAYGIEIFSQEDQGTRVRLTMPANDGCTLRGRSS